MDEFVKGAASFEETRNLTNLVGKRVLAKNNGVLGRVRQIRLGEDGSFEGIVVWRGLLRKSLYVSRDYIQRLEPEAVLLDITPVAVYRGLPVITSDGKRFGKVADIVRKGTTNGLTALVVRRWFRTVEIPKREVKKIHASVMLEREYEDAKAHLT